MSQKILCIVIPAYKEAERIGNVIRHIPKTFKVKSDVFKTVVVVVDDCSTDATSQVAHEAGARVIRHIVNCGAGGATRTGLKYAMTLDPEYVVTIDADGQHKPSDIKTLLACAIETDSDVVVGNRLTDVNKADMPFYRQFGNHGLSLISRILFGITVKDTQSGLRIFRGSVLPVMTDYIINRYGFCTEMLWQAQRNKLKVSEAPIHVLYSAETLAKGQNNWGVIDLVLDLIWVRFAR